MPLRRRHCLRVLKLRTACGKQWFRVNGPLTGRFGKLWHTDDAGRLTRGVAKRGFLRTRYVATLRPKGEHLSRFEHALAHDPGKMDGRQVGILTNGDLTRSISGWMGD